MNAHTKLTMHLARHMYKRGAYKGEAPADPGRRAKTHFRVVKGNGGQMLVRMHNADLITAYEDGRIKLDTRGWYASPTTRRCMNEALRNFAGMSGLSNLRYRGLSQTIICQDGKKYRYYDGMEFSADGALLTEPQPFMAKVTDREETAEFRKEVKESGFVGMFPVLYETAAMPTHGWTIRSKEKICNEHESGSWPEIVSLIKYPTYHARSQNKPQYDNHKDALRAFLASITRDMRVIVDTDVTVL